MIWAHFSDARRIINFGYTVFGISCFEIPRSRSIGLVDTMARRAVRKAHEGSSSARRAVRRWTWGLLRFGICSISFFYIWGSFMFMMHCFWLCWFIQMILLSISEHFQIGSIFFCNSEFAIRVPSVPWPCNCKVRDPELSIAEPPSGVWLGRLVELLQELGVFQKDATDWKPKEGQKKNCTGWFGWFQKISLSIGLWIILVVVCLRYHDLMGLHPWMSSSHWLVD